MFVCHYSTCSHDFYSVSWTLDFFSILFFLCSNHNVCESCLLASPCCTCDTVKVFRCICSGCFCVTIELAGEEDDLYINPQFRIKLYTGRCCESTDQEQHLVAKTIQNLQVPLIIIVCLEMNVSLLHYCTGRDCNSNPCDIFQQLLSKRRSRHQHVSDSDFFCIIFPNSVTSALLGVCHTRCKKRLAYLHGFVSD